MKPEQENRASLDHNYGVASFPELYASMFTHEWNPLCDCWQKRRKIKIYPTSLSPPRRG